MWKKLTAALVAATLCAAAALAQDKPAGPAVVLGPGDVVRITVFRHPDMATEVKVSEGGTILFPLLGAIRVAGLTTEQAAAVLASGLEKGEFVKEPQVSVFLVQARSRQVLVLGQVARPGKYPIEDASGRLADILTAAGGSTGSDTVTVMRPNGTPYIKLEIDVPLMFLRGDLTKNIEVNNGDIVFVQRAPIFYIYGEVARPGAYRLERKMIVMQALALAGGLTPRGTDRDIRVHRRDFTDNLQRVTVELTDLVEQDDVIYIRQSLF